jgi:hypothetical protein
MLAAHSAKVKAARRTSPPATKARLDQAHEAQSVQVVIKANKNELHSELEKKRRMREQKRQAEINDVHRKSGFTGYVRRLHGSFEGGKK